MNVFTHFAGSKCVVELNRPCQDWQLVYIDARIDVRYPDFSFIEVVQNGHVCHRENVHDSKAPERIVEMMRHYQRTRIH